MPDFSTRAIAAVRIPFSRAWTDTVYKTLQIPTTLPTLDELLGRPEYPEERIVDHYLSLLRPDAPNVLTIHAELEGMKNLALFRMLLDQAAGPPGRDRNICMTSPETS